MQIFGLSAAALSTQLLNPVLLVKPAKSPVQAAQSTTILIASSAQSDQAKHTQNTFLYMASSSGGITIIEEMMLSSSFSATASGIQSTSSFVEETSIFSNSGAAASYESAATLSISSGQNNQNFNFSAMA